MKVKSRFAGSVEAAFGGARHGLGEDALMVNSRKRPPKAGHLIVTDPPGLSAGDMDQWEDLARLFHP
jgi:hypothetical protein